MAGVRARLRGPSVRVGRGEAQIKSEGFPLDQTAPLGLQIEIKS